MAFKRSVLLIIITCTCLLSSGCGLMEMSFKAGFFMAIILAAIIGLLIWILHFSWKLVGKYFPSIRANFEGFWEE